MKKIIFSLLCLFMFSGLKAQDFNTRVQVLSPKIQTTNKRVFDVLETAIKDFLMGRKWSSDPILPQERLDCNVVINITDWDGSSNFKAEAQIQLSRPVYNSSYNSTLLNIADKDFSFRYTEGQIIDYNDQGFQDNLGSLLAFYAYMMLGLDNDSFSPMGGTPYFLKAQTVVTNAQTSSYSGWQAFDSNRNRYWLAENLNDKDYMVIREFFYAYHRNGLDRLTENAAKSRKLISNLLSTLTKIDQQKSGAMFPQIFFAAKADEIVSIFAKADASERTAVYNILKTVDPANGVKYQTLQKK
ncbi:MAG: DUF4835 family protein [Sphingobacteriaceae bacterium]